MSETTASLITRVQTKTVGTYTVIAAVNQIGAIKEVGNQLAWQASNTMQERFLADIFPYRKELCFIPELEVKAERSVEPINAWLRERGFDIQLRPLQEGGVATAAILDLLTKWTVAGTPHPIVYGQRTFEGVSLGRKHVQVFDSNEHPQPIALLSTQGGDRVYMTKLEHAPGGFDLVDLANLLGRSKLERAAYAGVQFPMVALNQLIDISWLEGMTTMGQDGLPVIITQALQQMKARLNEVGFRVENAVAVGASRGIGRSVVADPPLIIDSPYLLWVERQGLSLPLFTGHIAPDCWKNPGPIE